MPVAYYTKKPLTIPTLEWTGSNADELRAFCEPDDTEYNIQFTDGGVKVWNDQEHCWIPVPVGHVVARGALGELYPISPEALARTFDLADGS